VNRHIDNGLPPWWGRRAGQFQERGQSQALEQHAGLRSRGQDQPGADEGWGSRCQGWGSRREGWGSRREGWAHKASGRQSRGQGHVGGRGTGGRG
jgi:hypothetical protein